MVTVEGRDGRNRAGSCAAGHGRPWRSAASDDWQSADARQLRTGPRRRTAATVCARRRAPAVRLGDGCACGTVAARLREPAPGGSIGVGSLGLLPGSQQQPRRRRRDGRWPPRQRAPARPRAPGTYPSSIFFARFLPALRAFLGSSLPAPGGRTEERGGTSAAEAPATEDRRDPRRVARVFACSGGRGADRTEGRSAMTMTKGEEPASRPAPSRDATGDAPAATPRRSHVPADGTAAAARRRAGPQGDAPRGAGRGSAPASAPTR